MSLKRNLEKMENNNLFINIIPYNPQTNVWDLSGFDSVLDSITPRTKTPAQLALEAIIENNKKVKTFHSNLSLLNNKSIPVVLNPNAPEFVPTEIQGTCINDYGFPNILENRTEIINFSNNNNVDFFEPPAIIRKKHGFKPAKEDLDSVKKNLLFKFQEAEIQLDNQNMNDLESGEKYNCYNEHGKIVSKVVVWSRQTGNELLEIVRFDKSWSSFKDDRRSFKSFQEWDEFVDELTKTKEKEKESLSNAPEINWNDFKFEARTEDDDVFIIDIHNPSECCMDNFKEGTFFNCLYKGSFVSQVKFYEGYKLNHYLVEKGRLNKSSKKLEFKRLQFDSIQEWRDFVASSLV
jgi:hypothetical protein